MGRTMHIDIETYSESDLASVGVRAYAEHPSTEILLVGYAFDDGPVLQADLALGEGMPEEVIAALLDESQTKVAHNATFERAVFSVWLRKRGTIDGMLDPKGWRCTMVRAYQLGLPGSLEKAGLWLGIPDDAKKMAVGKKLIAKYCKPQRDGKRIFPQRSLEGTGNDWDTFKLYNRQDVIAEREVAKKEGLYPRCPEREWDLYRTDQRINDRGVAVDVPMAKTIDEYVDAHTAALVARAKDASGLDNPQSMPRAKEWLRSKGVDVSSLSKKVLDDLIAEAKDADVRAYLTARKELGKTSVTKYLAMERAAVWHSEEGCWRLHGTLQFDGAIRTGRWAGRIVQTQNLPRNTLQPIDVARAHAAAGRFDWLELEFGRPMDTLSQLIRTAFVPKRGCRFAVADYCQIECRVAAWMAGEGYKLDAFRAGKDIYKETAARIFRKKAEDITHEERQKGKVSELAGAYGGGIGAYKRFGADKMGLDDDEIQILVDAWRDQNPEIVLYWKAAETAFKAAITHPGETFRVSGGPIEMRMAGDSLFLRLPSGRLIAYKGARLSDDGEGGLGAEYLDTEEGKNGYVYVRTYGGKIFENIIQSTARDCLGEALLQLDQAGYRTVFHVHDECINEVPAEGAEEALEDIQRIMRLEGVAWAKGIPLDSDGYVCDFYKKED